MFYFVVYVSSVPDLLTDQQLNEILEVSRRNNEVAGISGALLYQDGNIMQVLEGEQGVVRALYRRIKADSRHHEVIEIIDGAIEERDFAEWSMAFGNLSQDTTVLGQQVRRLLNDPSQDPTRHIARALLRSFRDTMNL